MIMRTVIGALTLVLGLATGLQGPSLTGQRHIVAVVRGDTLRALGSRFGVDPVTIARDSRRTLDAPLRIGETLTIDNRHVAPAFGAGVSIVVNVPQRILFAAIGHSVVAYPVAVGRAEWPTPLGEFSIATKETNPSWDVPESIRAEARRAGRSLPARVPPGPNNPLGAYWLGLSPGRVGINSTNAPRSIYQVITHGCIRLHPDDIAALFGHVRVGARGQLVYQPLLVGVDGDEVFVEAHRDVYRRGPRDPLEFVKARARELGVFDRVDWAAAARVIGERAGIARAVTRGARSHPAGAESSARGAGLRAEAQ